MSDRQLGDDRSVGELVSQLVDEGRSYARAEARLWRTIASERSKALKLPAVLLFTALLFAQGGVTALCVALFLALLPLVGPFFAGVLAMILALAVAGALGGTAYLLVRRSWS